MKLEDIKVGCHYFVSVGPELVSYPILDLFSTEVVAIESPVPDQRIALIYISQERDSAEISNEIKVFSVNVNTIEYVFPDQRSAFRDMVCRFRDFMDELNKLADHLSLLSDEPTRKVD